MNPTVLHAFRRRLVPAWLLGLSFLSASPARAATGDIVAICFNSDGNDDFALMALANIAGGSRFFICDNAWSTNANNLIQEGGTPSPNRQIQLDVAAGGIPFGTVLKFDQSGANVVLTDPSLGTLTMVARFPVSPAPGSTKLSFGNAGDQILIYQTAGNTVSGTATMVSAFSNSPYTNPPGITISNGWQVGALPQAGQDAATSECNAPAGLVIYDGTNAATATAFGLANLTVSGLTQVDNYKYNGPFGLADKTAYLTAINNPANWLANDTVPFDLSGVGPGTIAEINLVGNGVNIADGSATALAADHTLFGSANVTGGTLTRTFTIQNVGTANLTIPSGAITFSGTNAAEFTASGISLPAVLAPAGSATFVVTFDPTAVGSRTATVNIANDDSNENPYNFAIQGFGFNYTAPAGTPPPLRWSSTVQSTNVGATRAVGSTTSGDIISATKINAGNAGNIRVIRHARATGAAVWTRDYDSGNSDDVNDMLVDPATGDTFIAARASVASNLNWFVHKVNGADGTHGWTYTFDGTAAGGDNCNAIARTSDGNIVVVGDTQSSPSNSNYARAVKLNASTGAVMATYTSATDFSQFNGVATDGSGNTYATGFINAGSGDGVTLKLNGSLAVVWTQTFNGAASLSDSLAHVAILPTGDCVVGGTTRTTATNSDVILLRYGSAAPGTEVWRRVIAGAADGSDSINNLIADAGDLYVAGALRNVSSTDRDAFVSKITGSTGAVAWTTTRLGTAADSSDRFQNIRVSGSAAYAVGNIENTNRDIIASRFNANTGAEEWTFAFNGSGNGTDDVFSGKSVMTLLGTDAIGIGGESFDVSGNTYGIVLRYAPVLPPTVSNVAKTASEDVGAAFAALDFTGSYSDPDSIALATVRITSLPANGQLKISGATFTAPRDIAIGSIGALTYTSNLNYNGADSFGWNGSNGTLFATSAATVNLTVTAVNDQPTVTAPASINVTEDTPTALSGISFGDVDAGNASVTATFSVSSGTVAATNGGGVTVGGAGNARTLSGSVTNINTFIATNQVSFMPALNTTSNVTLTVGINDGGSSGSGGALTNSANVTLALTAVNDPPDVAAAGPFTIAENAAISATVGAMTATDVENNTPFTWSITAGNTGGAFAINSSGQITVAAALDFESTPSYNLTVRAVDSGAPPAQGQRNVTVNLTNVTDYGDWKIANFSPTDQANALISGPNADPNADGITNAVAYALNLNPFTHSQNAMPDALPETRSGQDYYIFTFPKDTSKTDITYHGETSPNVTTWNPQTGTVISTVGTIQTIEIAIPVSGTDRFARLRIGGL